MNTNADHAAIMESKLHYILDLEKQIDALAKEINIHQQEVDMKQIIFASLCSEHVQALKEYENR